MFATNICRPTFQARRQSVACLWQRLSPHSYNRLNYQRCINVLTNIPPKQRKCSTFVFRVQYTGHSSISGTYAHPLEKHIITPLNCVPRRFYQQNSSVLNSKNKTRQWIFAVGLGSLLCLYIGWYKMKTEICSCDEQCHDVEKQRKSLTLQEAINKSRDLATRIKDETGSPGLAISVSVDGKEIWSEGLGYADVENRVPCCADTVLRIASISKSISMVAVAKQLEAGTLDLDKPVQHYVPNFPEKKVDGKKVTITTRHLVSHLGGIRHYHTSIASQEDTKPTKTNSSDKKTNKETEKKPNTESVTARQPELTKQEYFISDHYDSVTESMNLFKDDPLVHEPGTKYLYTSHGFTLLSAVIEAVAKTPFDKLMKEYFVQMGMESTFLDENTPLIYNRGRHYMKDKNGRLINTPYVDLSYKWAGGGFLSSTRDLIKFGHVMLYSYQHDTVEQSGQSTKVTTKNSKVIKRSNQGDEKANIPGFLKKDSVQMLWEPVDKTKCDWDKFGYYGMGWAVVPQGENFGQCHHSDHIVSHTGGAVGGSSALLIKPKKCDSEKGGQPKGIVVAMIVNMTGVGLYKTAVKIANLFEEASI